MDNIKSIFKKLKAIPLKPGVYLMKDILRNTIYVGKAKNLKNRVSQYFHKQKNREPKVEEMIQNIADVEYRVMDTELDALLEECRLIKELKPRYNRQMKNDQKYVYLKIPNEEFPKVGVVQEREEDGALYYGPYNSRHRVETALEYLNERFFLRKCSTSGLKRHGTGCLYRQLGTCLGVCTGKINPEEYKAKIEAACRAIEGKDKGTLKELKCILETAAEDLQFEKAARYREYLLGLRYIQGRAKFLSTTRRNKSLIAFEFLDKENLTAKLFLIKGNKLLLSKVVDLSMGKSCSNLLRGYHQELSQFLKVAQGMLHTDQGSPRQLTQQELDKAQIIDSYLKKERIISVQVPQKALKQEDFVEDMLARILGYMYL